MVPRLRTSFFVGLCALALAACATTPPPITALVGGHPIATRSISPDAYEHVARALLYEDEGEWTKATAELRLALAIDSDSPELHAHLAELLLRSDALGDAADEVRASLAIAKTATGLLAEAHLRRARGDVAGEVAALGRATAEVDFDAENDDAEDVYLELAEAELEALDVPAARHTLEKLTQAEPSSGTGHMRLTAIYWAQGEMAKAEAELRAALAQEPNQIEALAALAWLQVATGREADARATFREALDRSDGSLELAAAFARFLVASGHAPEAAQLADDYSVPQASLDADTITGRIELERSAHRFDRALALVAQARKQGIAEDEKNRFTLRRAAILKEQGKTHEAITALLEVARSSPLYFEARLRAAELLREAGNFPEATRTVEEAAQATAGPTGAIRVEATISLALIEEKRGDAAAGVARLRKALAQHPDDGRVLLTLASLEERSGKWQAALDRVQGYLAKHPDSVEALNFWGFVAADHDHALELANRRLQVAAALDPGSGGLIDSLGWVRFRKQDLAMAATFLEQATRLEPSDPEICWHLGEVYAARQQPERAAATFRRALTLNPDQRVRRKLEASLARVAGRKMSSP